ncbi:MAG: hypothetical protein IPP90_16400 [Gemmatimonadaceae bacterium]|nr:hypothetical protein [Gemmatimonadaceae bacterium]
MSPHAVSPATGVGGDLPPDAVVGAELEIKYSGYCGANGPASRACAQMGPCPSLRPRLSRHPDAVDGSAPEAACHFRPRSLGQASQIPGISPSDLQNLLIEPLATPSRQRPDCHQFPGERLA